MCEGSGILVACVEGDASGRYLQYLDLHDEIVLSEMIKHGMIIILRPLQTTEVSGGLTL